MRCLNISMSVISLGVSIQLTLLQFEFIWCRLVKVFAVYIWNMNDFPILFKITSR